MTPEHRALIESCSHPGVPKQWIVKWPSLYYSTPAPRNYPCVECGCYVIVAATLVGDDVEVTA